MNGFTYEDYKVAEATKELQQKIDRLNNIINELEKWLEKESMFEHYERIVLDKLKELKEEGNK